MNERSFIFLKEKRMSVPIEDKRTRILDATEKLLAQDGFQGLSMQKVAKEAEVAAGTIYRYFEDKPHLIEETRLYVSQRAANYIQANLTDDMSLKEQYRTIWLNIWNLNSTKSAVKSHFLYEQFDYSDESKIFQREKEMFYKVVALFEQGKEQGIFKPLNVHILFCVSLDSSIALARKQKNRCIQVDSESLEQAIEASWDAIIKH